MSNLIIHNSSREFLQVNYNYLAQNELENNLILGICLGLPDKDKKRNDYTFLSVISGQQIEAVSFCNTPRIIITGDPEKDEAVSKIAEYYQSHKIKIGGVFGEKKIAGKFADKIKLKQIKKREMIVHGLDKTDNLQLSRGKFVNADLKDIDLLFEYRIAFDNEVFGYSRIEHDVLKMDLENKILRNDLFTWICDGEIVSMAAVMRRTKNIGIIGIVYTPEKFRGNGYASSLVLSLSNEILKSGLSKCGLFTDKSNPTSNHIYYKIGYRPVIEHADIYFKVNG